MHRYALGLRVALLSLLFASAMFAQRDLATLVGTVSDPSGGVIANAKVTISETGTGQVYTLATGSSGDFVRPALKPAAYTVNVSAPGFRQAEQKAIVLTAGERTGITITLTVGDVGQTVEVMAAAPLLQTESTQIGAALNSRTDGSPKIVRSAAKAAMHLAYAFFDDAQYRTSPSGMKHSHGAAPHVSQKDGKAVRGLNCQKKPGSCCDQAIASQR